MEHFEALQKLLKNQVLFDEPMKKHTTWQIGGPADLFLRPENEAELCAVLRYCDDQNLPLQIIGNGSNLLVGDKGIRGAVIQLGSNYSAIEWLSDGAIVQAGAMLTAVAKRAAQHDLCGMECLAGIPGSIGGAVYMNAGAYGFHIGEIITSVRIIEYNGDIRQLDKEELQFAYRHSNVREMNGVISNVQLSLQHGDGEASLAKMRELMELRASKQPLEFPSCGSVFINPENDHAGRLIEAAGLKGKRVGDAMVSPKHGNFIINLGNASAADVQELMLQVQAEVEKQFGIRLAAEVRLLGE
ncbi:MAG: UDP-N-acetylmuramate dehydrogenase [Firmicutes bacterium]|nr:UDP-N-acetylmuramate dehydrogenase [Bacillota bacterium]